MKKIVTFITTVILCVMSIQARTFVLITGISNYGNGDINLAQTTKDAKRFKEVMATQTKDITLLTSSNVTRANVLEKLSAICNRAQKDDRIIFFYSGHGMPGAICGYDAAISYEDIVALLEGSLAKEKFCFIDACHAGTMAKSATDDSWTKAIKGKAGQVFFVSCRSDEYSAESPILGACYFTQALLKGMRGKADKDNNREITVMELFKYIHTDVVKRSKQKQHPQLIAPQSMYNMVITKW